MSDTRALPVLDQGSEAIQQGALREHPAWLAIGRSITELYLAAVILAADPVGPAIDQGEEKERHGKNS